MNAAAGESAWASEETMSDKGAMLQLLDKEYQNLVHTIDGLDPDQLTHVWYGSWAVKDIIAHILGWEKETTGLLQHLAQGERLTQEAVECSDADERNARFVQEMASVSPAAVLTTWRQVHMKYVRAANEVPEERFGEGMMASLLVCRTALDDFRQHAADIREWRRREGI